MEIQMHSELPNSNVQINFDCDSQQFDWMERMQLWDSMRPLTQPTPRRPTKQFPFLFPCRPALLYTCLCTVISR